jgi:hypothetical protein
MSQQADSRRASDLSYHARKCSICRHPQRAEIEQALLNWDCISSITTEYHLPGRAALYRHAHAVGLFARRNRGLRGALARIIEKASEAEPDALTIVRAVELFARINDHGEWIAPASSVTSTARPPGSSQRPRRVPARCAGRSIHVRVENDATR